MGHTPREPEMMADTTLIWCAGTAPSGSLSLSLSARRWSLLESAHVEGKMDSEVGRRAEEWEEGEGIPLAAGVGTEGAQAVEVLQQLAATSPRGLLT